MPLTYSIANGIGVGFVAWVVIQAASGRARRIHWLLWIVAVLFVAYFARGAITGLVGEAAALQAEGCSLRPAGT